MLLFYFFLFFFKQKTAYELRISDWSSYVCSSDLNIIAELRKSLGKKGLLAPIEQIERYRSHRLIPVLTNDVNTVSSFAFSFAPLAIAFTVTLGCLGYLAYLSLPMFLLLLVALVIGTEIGRAHV